MKRVLNGKNWASAGLMMVVVSLLFITGCLTAGPKFQQPTTAPADQSVIHFYRLKHFIGANSVPSIFHGDRKVLGPMGVGTYATYAISPGEHTFDARLLLGLYKKVPVTITNEKPGQVYYVRLDVEFGKVALTLVDPQQALTQITACNEIQS